MCLNEIRPFPILPHPPRFPYNILHDTQLRQILIDYFDQKALTNIPVKAPMENFRLVITITGSVIVFILFSSAISWITALIAGWPELVEKYPARQPQKHACWWVRSVKFGGGSLRWSIGNVKVCADTEGMHASVGFLPSLVIGTFSVPSHEINGLKKTHRLDYGVELHFQRVPDIPMHISIVLANKLVKASDGAWQYEDG